MKNIFIIGSKGIPANYGGFETFVEKLTKHKKSQDIKYYVSCLSDENEDMFFHNKAECFNVKVPNIGPAKAVYYDIMALKKSIDIIKTRNLENCVIYILTSRIGPFIGTYKRELKKLKVKYYLNPDGHEWKRSKWNAAIKKYWKVSESLMIKHADLVICDAIAIEEYIKKEYGKNETIFISYGADILTKEAQWDDLSSLYDKFSIKKNNYYLIVGRFVPENNYKLMIEEFMKSSSKKDLVIVTNVEKNKFYQQLRNSTGFEKDPRIKFIGTVYDEKLLWSIRANAYGYLHGHEVGGTNPSLLEALSATKLNLLLDVIFNREVGDDAAIYFNKEDRNLAKLIDEADNFSHDKIEELKEKSSKRVEIHYSWDKIINQYEKLFLKE